jgi:hypothetical protein
MGPLHAQVPVHTDVHKLKYQLTSQLCTSKLSGVAGVHHLSKYKLSRQNPGSGCQISKMAASRLILQNYRWYYLLVYAQHHQQL